MKYLREWGSLTLGLSLFVFSLPFYESFSSKIVLGRWSYSYTAILTAALVVWVGYLFFSLRASRTDSSVAGAKVGRRTLGFAFLFWGIAYFWSTMIQHTNAGRFTNLNFFGSIAPGIAILEWLALLAFSIALLSAVTTIPSKRLQEIGLIVASSLLFVTVGEGIARAKALGFPQVQGFPTNSNRIWRQRFSATNALGYRDVERSPIAEQGVRRIVVIGDSYTFGAGVNDVSERYTEQLEEKLNATTEQDWEVINAGRSDTHTLEHIAALEVMLRYDPDLVVLLYAFNDMDYLSPNTERGWTSGQGSLRNLLNPTRILFTNSYLFQEVYIRLRTLSFRGAETGPQFDAYTTPALVDTHVADLDRFVKMAASAGARTVIVPFDNLTGVMPRAKQRYRAFATALGEASLPICSIENAFDEHEFADLRVNQLDSHGNGLAYGIAVDSSLPCISSSL